MSANPPESDTGPETLNTLSPTLTSSLDAPSPPKIGQRSASSTATSGMTSSSTPLGPLNAARRPGPPPPSLNSRGSGLNVSQDMLARIQAVTKGRQGAPPPNIGRGMPTGGAVGSPAPVNAHPGSPNSPLKTGPGGIPANFKLPIGLTKPTVKNFASSPAVPSLSLGGATGKPSLAEKRGQMLPGGLPGSSGPATPGAGGRKKPLSLIHI